MFAGQKARVISHLVTEERLDQIARALTRELGYRERAPLLTRKSYEEFHGRLVSDEEWSDAAARAEASGQWDVSREA